MSGYWVFPVILAIWVVALLLPNPKKRVTQKRLLVKHSVSKATQESFALGEFSIHSGDLANLLEEE